MALQDFEGFRIQCAGIGSSATALDGRNRRIPGITVDTAGFDRQNRKAISGRVPGHPFKIAFKAGDVLDDLVFAVATKIGGAKLARFKLRVLRNGSGEAAFVERDPRQDTDIKSAQSGNRFVSGAWSKML